MDFGGTKKLENSSLVFPLLFVWKGFVRRDIVEEGVEIAKMAIIDLLLLAIVSSSSQFISINTIDY